MHTKVKKKKNKNITKLARKLQATAEMMHAGLGTFGAKLALTNVAPNKRKKTSQTGFNIN